MAVDIAPDTPDATRQKWAVKPDANTSIGYHSRPALSTDGKTLVFGSDLVTGNAGAVIAIDLDKVAVKWTYPATDTEANPGSIFGGVVIVSNTAYFAGGSGALYALDVETGTPKWPKPFDTGARIWSTPAVSGTLAFVASQDHHLYAVNTADGTLAWRYPAEGDSEIGTLAGSPSVLGDRVYFGSFDSNMYALDLNGKLQWKFQAAGRLWGPPAEISGTLYFGDLSGDVYALDAATGQSKWPEQPPPLEGGIVATPLVTADAIYVGTDQFKLYALGINNGRSVWQGPFVGQDGETMLTTPVLVGDSLLVQPMLSGANPVRLYSINKVTGAEQWRFPLPPANK